MTSVTETIAALAAHPSPLLLFLSRLSFTYPFPNSSCPTQTPERWGLLAVADGAPNVSLAFSENMHWSNQFENAAAGIQFAQDTLKCVPTGTCTTTHRVMSFAPLSYRAVCCVAVVSCHVVRAAVVSRRLLRRRLLVTGALQFAAACGRAGLKMHEILAMLSSGPST